MTFDELQPSLLWLDVTVNGEGVSYTVLRP
jgi:hypothetical protein